jgi:hypothetical protein
MGDQNQKSIKNSNYFSKTMWSTNLPRKRKVRKTKRKEPKANF